MQTGKKVSFRSFRLPHFLLRSTACFLVLHVLSYSFSQLLCPNTDDGPCVQVLFSDINAYEVCVTCLMAKFCLDARTIGLIIDGPFT